MLCSVEELLCKDKVKPAIVLTVLQFQFRINAYCYMLCPLVDRTVDVVFCSGVILEPIYCILYVILSVSQLWFAMLLLEKETTLQASTLCKYYQCL